MDLGCGRRPLRFWKGDGREAEVLKLGGGGALSFSSFPPADTHTVAVVEAFVAVADGFNVALIAGAPGGCPTRWHLGCPRHGFTVAFVAVNFEWLFSTVDFCCRGGGRL